MFYKWGVRAAVGLLIAFLFWQMNVAQTQRDVAVERANQNKAKFDMAQSSLLQANEEISRQVSLNNNVVQSLMDAASAQREANKATISTLTQQSALWRERSGRLNIVEGATCDDRLRNIDEFLNGYIGEVRRASMP